MVLKTNTCFTCGKIIGHLYEPFEEEVRKYHEKLDIPNNTFFSENISYADIFKKLGISEKKYCCRKFFVTSVSITDILNL
jgi:DNA-directed RNA polymerase subunit N (RpoN/RPB10)